MSNPTHQPTMTIRQLRQARGWSQVTLGVLVGVTGRTISNWERGLTQPSPDQLQRLADLFGISVEAIAFGPVEQP